MDTPQEGITEMLDKGLTSKVKRGISPDDLERIIDERWSYLESKVSIPGNQPTMLLQKEKDIVPVNYVYYHIDQDGKVVYVGIGSGGRAYDAWLRRKTHHARWMIKEQMQTNDYVFIVQAGMYKEEAKKLETGLIKQLAPRFNDQGKELSGILKGMKVKI